MKRDRAKRILALLLASVTGCSTGGRRPPQLNLAADPRPCAQNFKVTGSPQEGLSFTTHEDRADAVVPIHFDRAERALAAKGYQVNNTNRQSGVVSSSAHANAVTVNVILRPSTPSGHKIEMIGQLRSGATTAPAAVVKEFCEIIKEITG